MKIRYAIASTLAAFGLSIAAQAQSNPPVWNATESYKIGDLVTYEGATFQCQINENSTHPNPHTPPYWGVNYVYSGMLPIPVGASEPLKTLTAAYAYISGARIANNSSIIIELQSNYSETFSSSFSLNHPYGAQISIIGKNNGGLATFTGTVPGFTLDSGHTLADFEGLKIVGPVNGTINNPAFWVHQNACLNKLQNITIQNFDIGLEADTSGTIDNVGGLSLSQFANGGVEAFNNSTINVTSAITIDGSTTQGNFPPSYGFYAQGGTVQCPGCSAINCTFNFEAAHGGKIEAPYSTSMNSGSIENTSIYAYYATDHGYIYAIHTVVSGSADGFFAEESSNIDAVDSSSSNSSDNDYLARTGGTINAASHNSGATGSGDPTHGAYIFDF